MSNAAAPALEIKARPERLALGMMIANAPRNPANLADRPEIERATPDERPDRLEKIRDDPVESRDLVATHPDRIGERFGER